MQLAILLWWDGFEISLGNDFRRIDAGRRYGSLFWELAVDFGSIGWHFLGLLLTFAIMLMGVSKGIEKMNKVMMPIFFIFSFCS